MKILGYEDITAIRKFEAEPGIAIILYKESEENKTAYPFGILLERQYKGKADYDLQRDGAFIFDTVDKAIDEFTGRINHYLKCLNRDGGLK